MKRKYFYLIFIGIFVITACDAAEKGVSVQELVKLYKDYEDSDPRAYINPKLGYCTLYFGKDVKHKIGKLALKKDKNYLIVDLFLKSDLGKKYATLTKGKPRFRGSDREHMYTFQLTDLARKEGAFVRYDNFYIPLGKLTFQIIDQEVTESDTFGLQNRINFSYEVELNTFGQEVKRIVESKYPMYKNSDEFRDKGKLTTMLWKDPEKNMWTTSSKYEKRLKN